MVNKWLNNIQSIVYPSTCLLCGAPGDDELDICSHCRQELPANLICCKRCAAPVAASGDPGRTCGACIASPPPFDQCITPFLYQAPVDSLISGFKFRKKLGNGKLLSRLLIDFLKQQNVEAPDIILPIPLHWKRLTERGFNQALEIARPISSALRLPLDHSTCIRRHSTTPQMKLEKRNRLRNLKGAFEIRGNIDVRHLVLLDDVVTTGATVSELAALLKKRGAERVDVWALARTP